jgi:hypothetical protein
MATNGKKGTSKRALRRLYQQELDQVPVGDPRRLEILKQMTRLEGHVQVYKRKDKPPEAKPLSPSDNVCAWPACGSRAPRGMYCAAHSKCQWYTGCDETNIGTLNGPSLPGNPDAISDGYCQGHIDELSRTLAEIDRELKEDPPGNVLRKCETPGCNELTTSKRCPLCKREGKTL